MESSCRERAEIGKELYTAAVRGKIDILQQTTLSHLLSLKSFQNNNILHIATRHEQLDFILSIFSMFPFHINNKLLCDRNSLGNTPLHVAAEVGNLSILALLYNHILSSLSSDDDDDDEKRPWRMKNKKGNTPVHVAIIHDNVTVARFLLDNDIYLASVVNNSLEAPLHLAIKHHVSYSESVAIKSRLKQANGVGEVALSIKYAPGENMSSIINFLVEKQSCVSSWPDSNGLTPLHRATSLSIPYNFQIIKSILYHCPQSAEVCDSSGKTVLHLLVGKLTSYQVGKSLLNCNEIYTLKNYQDHHGNTPLHIAAKNKDIDMIRALLDSSAKVSIINKDGVSSAYLIQQQNLLEMLTKRKMKVEESEAAVKGKISCLRAEMSMLGANYFLLSRDPEGRNILHKLMDIESGSQIVVDDFVDFIQQIIESSPALICQTDHNGDTPIHVLVRSKHDSVLRKSGISSVLLALFNQCILKFQEQGRTDVSGCEVLISPLLIQNAQGNAPIHEAIIAQNARCARILLAYDLRSAGLVNKCQEAPLHLVAKVLKDGSFYKEDVELLVNAKPEAALWLDKDGNTPVLNAVQVGNVLIATELCNLSPEGADVRNAKGQIFWHFVINYPSSFLMAHLLRTSSLRNLLRMRDIENGNTPLHQAIKSNRFELVKELLVFLEKHNPPNSNENQWLVDIFHIRDSNGESIFDLLVGSAFLPSYVERIIRHKNEMIGVCSVWGIPTKEMNTYVNTLGIIAALLTTITFTAAFTVPGGLIQDTGTPLLIGKTAFQVFLVSDIIAMCLSMMVLFCLLWIMATSDRRNSVIILDFSISLLLASFCATLLTFIAGLYATTFVVKPWIAIFTLVLCTLLMLLVHKCLVFRLLIPFGKATLIFFRNFWRSLEGLKTIISRKVGDQPQIEDSRSRNHQVPRHRSIDFSLSR